MAFGFFFDFLTLVFDVADAVVSGDMIFCKGSVAIVCGVSIVEPVWK